MPEAKRKIIMLFSREMKRILGENLKKVILYGSYARGDYTKDSDIDIGLERCRSMIMCKGRVLYLMDNRQEELSCYRIQEAKDSLDFLNWL